MLEKKKVKNYIKNFLNFKNLLNNPVPIYTDYNQKVDGLRLHLGCGEINLQGWINIDGRDDKHIHLVSKDLNLKAFKDNSISEIYVCHVIEHFSYAEGHDLIKVFMKKLVKGGILRISVPDFDKLISIYNKNNKDFNSIKSSLMGGQNYKYNFHKSMYNKKSLKSLLEEHGFVNCVEWDPISDFGVSLGDFSDAKLKTKINMEPISLNIKATVGK